MTVIGTTLFQIQKEEALKCPTIIITNTFDQDLRWPSVQYFQACTGTGVELLMFCKLEGFLLHIKESKVPGWSAMVMCKRFEVNNLNHIFKSFHAELG
jgi:hypothetical protein